MLHACFASFITCFTHTLYRFIMISGNNLLTRCRSASSCFLLFLVSEILHRKYSRNSTKQSQKSFSRWNTPEGTRPDQRRARGWPHPRAAWPRGGPRRPMVWAPLMPPYAATSPIYSFRRGIPRGPIRNPRKVSSRPPSSTLDREGSGVPPGTLPERRIITGGSTSPCPPPV